MGTIDKNWLEQQIREWQAKGWLSGDGAAHIRHAFENHAPSMSLPLLVFVAAVGISIAGVALIWGLSAFWYQVSMVGRMGLSVALLLFSQVAVGVAMFRGQQGTWAGEAIAVVHALVLGVVLALTCQTFYTGWDTASYLAGCALLSLPVIYLLRSAGVVILYALAVLLWASAGGPVNAWGGAAFIWVLLVPLLPFYGVLQHHNDEIRLSLYSWTLTITVFAAFGLAALDSAYIPFLLLATLAVAIMLTGYSIDIRKAWGVPFRWFGRCAAAGSLLISALPGSWYGIANIQGFHWTTTAVTVVLFLAILALLVKGVKKRFWGPVLYAGIPVIIAAETVLVRNGLYSSVPLLVSSIYLLAIGIYEMVQGLQTGHTKHVKFGICVFLCLLIGFFQGGGFSPVVLVLAFVIFALVFIQIRRTSRKRKDTAERVQHRTGLRHQVTTLRTGNKTRSHRKKTTAPPQAEDVLAAKDAAAEAESLPEWMKDIHMPEMPAVEEAAPAVQAVTPKEPEKSQFVAPVFHNPDDIPLPHIPVTQPAQARQEKTEDVKQHGSPWGSIQKRPEREKHFTHSPWSAEGEDK